MPRIPIYLFLLPIFFVLQVSKEYAGMISFTNQAKLAALLLLSEMVLTFFAWLFFRNWRKAELFAFTLLCFYLFFGLIQDITGARYRLLVPAGIISLLFLLFYLKRSQRNFNRLIFYLDSLLIILVVIGMVQLYFSAKKAEKKLASTHTEKNIACNNCAHPDIYFIILDEYAGEKSLAEKMGFSNERFTASLEDRGFRIMKDSRSNYNSTPFSIASMLDMRYPDLNMKGKETGNLPLAFYTAYRNRLTNFFRENGYDIINLTSFSIEGTKPMIRDGFIPSQMKLLTSQTFSGRLARDIRYDLITGKKENKRLLKNIIYREAENNQFILEQLSQIATETKKPKIILAHLMMPHSPFYFDSSGRSRSLEWLTEKKDNQEGYLQYLRYTNKRILSLTDSILQRSSNPPVIILTSDHGYRRHNDPFDSAYCFNNLMAVYFPERNYSGFYEHMSNVNLGRLLLNNLFGQQWPLLKDSSVYLWKSN